MHETSDPSSPGGEVKRRRKIGKQADTAQPAVVDVWSPDCTMEIAFGELTGAARIEKIFQVFGDPSEDYMDVDWFQPDGKPTLVPDPINRPLQQSTVLEYERRIFDSGLAVDCSGGLHSLQLTAACLFFC